MRKFLAAAIAAAFMVSGFAVLAIADEGQDGTSWNQLVKPSKVDRPAASNNILEPAKLDTKGTDDPSDDHYNAPAKTVIKEPKGTVINTKALKRCNETPSDLQTGRASCPNKSKVGEGVARTVLGQPDAGGGDEVSSEIVAYNQKRHLLMLVTPCSPGTGPGTGADCVPFGGGKVALQGKWKGVNGKPRLIVKTPAQLLTGGIIITYFQLKTDKHTRKVRTRIDGERRRVLISYVTTPSSCKGRWTSFAILTYEDGSKQRIKDRQPCRRG